MRYRLMASYLGASYQAAVGPSDHDVTLFAAPPPPEEHGFSPAPGGIWRKQVRLNDLGALWESRPIGSYHGEPCLVLDDLGDRVHIVYLGMDEQRAAQLGYWEVDRGVFEVVVPRHDVTDLAEERHEFPIALLLSALPRALGAGDPGGGAARGFGQNGTGTTPGAIGPGGMTGWTGPAAAPQPGRGQLPAGGPAQIQQAQAQQAQAQQAQLPPGQQRPLADPYQFSGGSARGGAGLPGALAMPGGAGAGNALGAQGVHPLGEAPQPGSAPQFPGGQPAPGGQQFTGIAAGPGTPYPSAAQPGAPGGQGAQPPAMNQAQQPAGAPPLPGRPQLPMAQQAPGTQTSLGTQQSPGAQQPFAQQFPSSPQFAAPQGPGTTPGTGLPQATTPQSPQAQPPQAQAPQAQASQAQFSPAQPPQAQSPQAQSPQAQSPQAQSPQAQSPQAQFSPAQFSPAQPPSGPAPQPPAPQAPASQASVPQAPTAAAAWHGSPTPDTNGTWYFQPGPDPQQGGAAAGGYPANGMPQHGYAQPDQGTVPAPPGGPAGMQQYAQPAPSYPGAAYQQAPAAGQPQAGQPAQLATLPPAGQQAQAAPAPQFLPPPQQAPFPMAQPAGTAGFTEPAAAGAQAPAMSPAPLAASPFTTAAAPAVTSAAADLTGTGPLGPVQTAPEQQPSAGLTAAGPLGKLTGAVRGRRAARKPRLAMSAIFADLVDMADIPRSAYAVDDEVTGAMCLFKTDGGYEVFSCAEDARHEVRFFEEEESAYFYLFGVLTAEALRNGRLGPRRG